MTFAKVASLTGIHHVTRESHFTGIHYMTFVKSLTDRHTSRDFRESNFTDILRNFRESRLTDRHTSRNFRESRLTDRHTSRNFRESRLTDNHISHKCAHGFLPALFTFCVRTVTVRTKAVKTVDRSRLFSAKEDKVGSISRKGHDIGVLGC